MLTVVGEYHPALVLNGQNKQSNKLCYPVLRELALVLSVLVVGSSLLTYGP